MQKIISLFVRDYQGTREIIDQVVPGAEWVAAGEGVATRKFDGTCCMVRDNVLYKRYDAKHGKTPPAGFEPAQEADSQTGHWPGWVEVNDFSPEDQWHREAFLDLRANCTGLVDLTGTYELIGPKVRGNPEGTRRHQLIRHGGHRLADAPRDFNGLKTYFAIHNIEGIVWHHPDGRMVKIKAKDFGFERAVFSD